MEPSKNIYRPRNHCIVLDLDHTLLCTFEDQSPDTLQKLGIFTNPKLLDVRKRSYHFQLEDLGSPGSGVNYIRWGIMRPYTKEFLLFCSTYFKEVIVWSAGMRQYVEAVVDEIFKDLTQPRIFTRDHIEIINQETIKDLTKVYNGVATERNTFILDDIVSNFARNPGNGILIPEYNPAATISSIKSPNIDLKLLETWLLRPEVVYCEDVRTLNKDIFKYSLEELSDPHTII